MKQKKYNNNNNNPEISILGISLEKKYEDKASK